MQSDSHQVLNIKGKDRHLNSHKSTDGEQSQQIFPQKVTTLSPKFNTKDILHVHSREKKNVYKRYTTEHITKRTTIEVPP